MLYDFMKIISLKKGDVALLIRFCQIHADSLKSALLR